MPTEEEIAEFMETPEGALELQRIMEDLRTASPIMSPGAEGNYGINPALIDPANQDQMDAYYGGGVPGSSFRPMANQLGVPLGGPTGQTAPDLRNYMDTGSFRGVTYGDPYFEDQLLPGGGEVPRGSGINPVEENRRRGTTLGASPNIPGATIGLPPDMSGINPVEENEKNRRRMMQQLMPSRGRGLGLGYR
jgi:hypothetical protein